MTACVVRKSFTGKQSKQISDERDTHKEHRGGDLERALHWGTEYGVWDLAEKKGFACYGLGGNRGPNDGLLTMEWQI